MIDPYLIGTVVFGVGFVAQTARASLLSGRCKGLSDELHGAIGNIGRMSRTIDTQRIQLDQYERAEVKRQAQRVQASQRAKEVLAERRTKEAAEAPARAAKTIEALKATPMRSRAQVVAPVKAKRTRAKNAALATT